MFSPDAWGEAIRSTYAATLIVAVAALLLGLAALAAPSRARLLSVGARVGIGIALALSGHASRAPPQALTWLVVLIHTTAVAFWVGSLVPLGFLLRDPGRGGRSALARFSAVIPPRRRPARVTGALLTIVQLDAVTDLWTTGYGRVLAAKLVGVSGLLVLAFVNRTRLTPAANKGGADGARRLRRSIAAEVTLVLVIFGLVATWRFTPPPRSTAAASEVAKALDAQTFFTHLHDAAISADITVSPARVGAVAISVVLHGADLAPLEARELSVAFVNEAAGIEPITRPAARQGDGSWQASGFFLPLAGIWQVRLDVLVSDFDRRTVAGPVIIAGPAGEAPPETPVAVAAADGHTHPAAPNIDLTDPLQVGVVERATGPTIAMAVAEAPGGALDLAFTFENFRFGLPADGIVHEPGVGHAHVFVDGLYVGQVDGPAHRVDSQTPGVHEIFVGLNALDHRAFVVDGALVAARVALRVADRRVFDVPIVLGPAAPTLRLRQGETLELRLTAAAAEVVHLHGYDIEVAVAPGSPVTVLFNANLAGRFVAEAHDAAETPVFFVEVVP